MWERQASRAGAAARFVRPGAPVRTGSAVTRGMTASQVEGEDSDLMRAVMRDSLREMVFL
jgi:hypothetical protein